MTQAVALAQQASTGVSPGFRNRIINGAMVIDQRNAGAQVTNTAGSVYTLDRWVMYGSQASKFTLQQNQGSVTPPVGFTNYLGCTSSSAYSVGASDYFGFQQIVEGLNMSDLAWGTANARSVSLSFWVRSSLTGTFGGALQNSGATYNFPFSYTISSANTWTYITVPITGPTSGTWTVSNTAFVYVAFSLGAGSSFSTTGGAWTSTVAFQPTGATSVVGTNGATLYITGVQLEVGSTATSFDYRPYGTELALCQRYYWKMYSIDAGPGAYTGLASGIVYTSTGVYLYLKYPVAMRAGATFVGSNLILQTSVANTVNSPGTIYPGTDSAMIQYNSLTSSTQGYGAILYCNGSASYFLSASAEL